MQVTVLAINKAKQWCVRVWYTFLCFQVLYKEKKEILPKNDPTVCLYLKYISRTDSQFTISL